MRVNVFPALSLVLVLQVVPVAAAVNVSKLYRTTINDVHLSVLLDIPEASVDVGANADQQMTPGDAAERALCQLGLDCGPPFTSEAVHSVLQRWRLPGDSIDASLLFRATLAHILSHPHLADLNVSIAAPASEGSPLSNADGQDASVQTVFGYRRPAQARAQLEQALRMFPETGLESALLATPLVVPAPVCPRYAELAFRQTLMTPVSIRLQSRQPLLDQAFAVDDPVALEQQLLDSLLDLGAQPYEVTRLTFGPALPTNGGYPDRVYAAVSEIGAGSEWRGNLKKLRVRLLLDDEVSPTVETVSAQDARFEILDARGEPALIVDERHGLSLRDTALSFWTNANVLPPWVSGAALAADDREADEVEAADGQSIARGGTGQNVTGFRAVGSEMTAQSNTRIGDESPASYADEMPSRPLYTLSPDDGQLLALDVSANTQARLTTWLDTEDDHTATEELELLRWVRGQAASGAPGISRDWLVGDVLSSQPVVVNYGTRGGYSEMSPNLRIVVGSGDGVLRVVQDTGPDGGESGREVFGFVPLELLSQLDERRDNLRSADHKLPGVDGAIRLAIKDRNSDGVVDHTEGDTALLFVGLGRGGASYYAFDASDPDVFPVPLWRISSTPDESTPDESTPDESTPDESTPDESTRSGPFAEMGSAVSPPVPLTVSLADGARQVVVFGGGLGEEGAGNVLFVVDALTGELLWKAVQGNGEEVTPGRFEHPELANPIAAGVVALHDASGLAYRAYVGDTGGILWRIDFGAPNMPDNPLSVANWTLRPVARLGTDVSGPMTGDGPVTTRRFFHEVDVVRSRDVHGHFDGVVIASGDLDNPGAALAQNYLFYIKDRDVALRKTEQDPIADADSPPPQPEPLTTAELVDVSACGRESAADASEACRGFTALNGWRLAFSQPGEKGVYAPVVDGGRVLATTYTPSAGAACVSSMGTSRLYAVRLSDAAPAEEGKSRSETLYPGPPAAITHVGSLLYLPGLASPATSGESGALSPVMKSTRATRLLDLYWSEHGVDAL